MTTSPFPRFRFAVSLSLLVLVCVSARSPASRLAAAEVDFAHEVLPLLRKHCAKCHANGTYKNGFSIDDRPSLLKSEMVVVGNSGDSPLVERLRSEDPEVRMPQKGQLTEAEIQIFERWIDGGVAWDASVSLKQGEYRAPLKLRRPQLPPVVDGRQHPVDRFVDAHFSRHGLQWPAAASDAVFLRRASLDLTGQLPDPNEWSQFLASEDPSKRARAVDLLLGDAVGYADHWLTFWNDLLRNDYSGTGYIDGGRKPITTWLYQSLLTNKPYDQFVRELIDPTPESEGFIKGIQWRGRVNASQVTPLQFSQNVSQVFLGINLKCASCHDSFINEWKLTDAYSLAAVVSEQPLAVHRCDVPTGEIATAGFLFPELGKIDPEAPRTERLQRLAQLLTGTDNGRLARTIVNRIWDRMLGRGIVYPVDMMDNPPWSDDLLDYLAADLVDHRYDLKRTMRQIATSRIYQSRSTPFDAEAPEQEYTFSGPIAKRMTAEQFQDAVWELTGSGPTQAASGIGFRGRRKVRASLVSSNLLTRSLGRPNREQVVTTRPAQLTTLQALDLTNGDVLAGQLSDSAVERAKQVSSMEPEEFVNKLYWQSLGRAPTSAELEVAAALLGPSIHADGIADLWWAVMMLPEFQTIP